MRGLGNGQPTSTAPAGPTFGTWYRPGAGSNITPPSPIGPGQSPGSGAGPIVPPLWPTPPYMGPPPGPMPNPQPQPLPQPGPPPGPSKPQPGPAPQLPWGGGASTLEPTEPPPGSDFAAVLRQNVIPVLVVSTALALIAGAAGYYIAKGRQARR